MTPQIILEALRRCGATFEGEDSPSPRGITKQDMMALGLSGTPASSTRRAALQKKLDLPEHLSSNALLQALNLLYDFQELQTILGEIP